MRLCQQDEAMPRAPHPADLQGLGSPQPTFRDAARQMQGRHGKWRLPLLGSLQALAFLRVTRRLARSPVALHIPFLSLNEWSNLAGGHCKAQ